MNVTTNTAYLIGLNAKVLTVNVMHEPNGQTTHLEGFDARDNWAREVMHRVRGAINTLGLPGGFVVSFDHKPPSNARPDLAIVAACVLAVGRETYEFTPRTIYLGEFNYTGQIMSTCGVLPILESVEGFTHAFVPASNVIEAGANTNRITCTTLANVHDLVDPSSTSRSFAPSTWDTWEPTDVQIDGRGLPGETLAELRAAVRSGRNVLIVGERAWGAAKCFHSMLPRLSASEARAVACMHSAAGLLTDGKSPVARPFRAPHHSITERGLVGGDWPVRPGEVSLANHGTLVLDHVIEFKRTGLSYLEDALRDKRVTIVRQDVTVEFPANTRVVATVYPDEVRFLTPERVAFLGDYVWVNV
jgi:magnesium chelatase family protein